MDYLIITKNKNGSISTKDTITDKTINHYFANIKSAEQRHRAWLGLKGKRFEKIIVEG